MKDFRKLMAGLVIVLLVLAGCNGDGGDASLFSKPGTYSAITEGVFGDEILTKVTVDKDSILAIDVWHVETFGYGERAINILKDEILSKQSLKVDNVSGATLSSIGFLTGVEDALYLAGGDMSKLKGTAAQNQYQDATVDVVVVGGGGAGMIAAIEIKEGNPDLNVVLLEKMGTIGGNTLRASTSVRGAGSIGHNFHNLPNEQQWAFSSLGWRGAGDTEYDAANDGVNGGYRFAELMASNIKYYINRVIQAGGKITEASNYAAYTLNTPDRNSPGPVICAALEREMARVGVDVRTSHAGVALVQDEGTGKITGVRVKMNPDIIPDADDYTYTLTANKAVLLTTGGWAANMDMREKYLTGTGNAAYINQPTTNSPGNTGDGHRMAEAIGAKLVNMTTIGTNMAGLQFSPGNTSGATLSLTTINNQSPVIVGPTGAAYTRNITTWPGVAAGTTGQVWLVFGHNSLMITANTQQYVNSGLMKRGNTLAELAANCGYTGAEATAFVTTVNTVITAADADTAALPARPTGTSSVTGNNLRNLFWRGEKGPFFAAPILPVLHGTSGGVHININCQALDEDGIVIPGLYAAGCVSNSGASPVITSSNMESPMAFGYAAAQVILGKPPYIKAW